jgi:tetratricopeptide (TPR) repeat protein
MGQGAEGIKDCEKSLQLRPNDTEKLEWLGWAFMRTGEPTLADANFDRALALNPKMAGSLYGKGLVAQRNGNPNLAGQNFAASKAIEPDIESILVREHIWPP